ncbi:hypothetical protein NAI82_10975, partial [Oxalobacter sp. JAC-2022]
RFSGGLSFPLPVRPLSGTVSGYPVIILSGNRTACRTALFRLPTQPESTVPLPPPCPARLHFSPASPSICVNCRLY